MSNNLNSAKFRVINNFLFTKNTEKTNFTLKTTDICIKYVHINLVLCYAYTVDYYYYW